MQKRRYQEKAIEAFKKWINNPSGNRHASILLATGVGKSATTAWCIETIPQLKVLWVAHREELIVQAYNTIKNIIPNVFIEIEMADKKANNKATIVVGSVQTLARNRKHFKDFIPDLIICDEMHHMCDNNTQYSSLLEKYPNARILGLTATPWRASGEELNLGEILIQMDIGTAIDKGYLVPLKPEVLVTDVSLANVPTRMGDFDQKALSQAVNVESRNKLIADKVVQLVKEQKRQGILFAVDVAHSKAMYQLLKDKVRAVELYGETPKDERAEIIARIRNKEVDIICNNLLMIEGADFPHLSFVVMARPTRSLGAYFQCIGRGTRLNGPDKKDCIVVDVFDKIKVKQTRISYKDMADKGDLSGDRKRAVNILEAKAEVEIEGPVSKLINFPIFVRPEKMDRWQIDDESFSLSSWVLNTDQWIISWSVDKKTQRQVAKSVWVPFDTLPPSHVNLIGRPVKHDKFGEGTIKSIAEQGNEPKIVVNFGWNVERVILMKSLQRLGYITEDLPNQFDTLKLEKLF